MSAPSLRQTGAPTIADKAVVKTLARCLNVLEAHPADWRRKIVPHDLAPTATERTLMQRRLAHLRESMTSDPTAVRATVAMLISQYRTYGRSREDAEIDIEVWTRTLRHKPWWAVQETVDQYLSGQVLGADNRRGPTLPEFAVELGHRIEPISLEILRLERVLGAEVDAPIDPRQQAKLLRQLQDVIDREAKRPIDLAILGLMYGQVSVDIEIERAKAEVAKSKAETDRLQASAVKDQATALEILCKQEFSRRA